MIEVVPATEELVERFLPNLRRSDRAEIWALARRDHASMVRHSFQASQPEVKMALDDGDPVALFGIGSPSPLGRVGVPWLLGTDRMMELGKPLMQISREYLREALRFDYDILTNVVWDENRRSIRYLKALGFKVDPPRQHPITREWLRAFTLKRSDVYV